MSQPPPPTNAPARPPLLGIVSVVLVVVGGASLGWASLQGSAGDLITLIGVDFYNPARAVMFCLLLLGTALGIVALRTGRGRWWGLVGLILGGGTLLLIIVVVVLMMLLFALIGGIFTF